MTYNPEQKPEKSLFGVIVHSFFVVPFLIAVFSVLLFAAVRILTIEKQTVYDFLSDVKNGGSTKRWQAAFELSKILANPNLVPQDPKFDHELIKAFQQSQHDDNRVRQYLALAMGRTGHEQCVDPLVEALKNEKEENLYSVIYALGLLKAQKAAPVISTYLDHPNSRIRLVSVMALGNINDPASINLLKRTLNDSEPNVQWDSAISLAKMKDLCGKEILLKLLDRSYLSKFNEIDPEEQTHVILVTMEVSRQLNDPQLNAAIKRLAETDQNMNVRKLAMEIVNKKI